MAILTQEQPRVLARGKLSLRRRPVVGKVAFLIAAAIMLLVAFCAIWPQSVAPYNPTVNSPSLRHKPPGFVDANGGVHPPLPKFKGIGRSARVAQRCTRWEALQKQ